MTTFFSWGPKDSVLEALPAPGWPRTNAMAASDAVDLSLLCTSGTDPSLGKWEN